ncbi:MAG: lipoate--protein ligase [Alloprevotella sp.]
MSVTPHFPARHVCFPQGCEERRAAFYLAAEEYIAEQLPEDNYLFAWQLHPTVVMGRNQIAHQEFDLDFCRRERIDICRRKSGGGAIFADRGNIMFSLITGSSPVEPLFAEYAEMVAASLSRLGAPTMVSGRNDVCLQGGGKICGNAFYHLPGRNIVHGTMLYDTDARLMAGALTPDKQKLQQRGVRSVSSRISLLKDALSFGVDELRTRLCEMLTDRSVQLTAEDVQHIEEKEAGYHTEDYLYGQTAKASADFGRRIDGVGELNLHLTVRGSLVEDVKLSGDFFELSDATALFRQAFIGRPYTHDSLCRAIEEVHPEQAIRRLTAADLIQMLTC